MANALVDHVAQPPARPPFRCIPVMNRFETTKLLGFYRKDPGWIPAIARGDANYFPRMLLQLYAANTETSFEVSFNELLVPSPAHPNWVPAADDSIPPQMLAHLRQGGKLYAANWDTDLNPPGIRLITVARATTGFRSRGRAPSSLRRAWAALPLLEKKRELRDLAPWAKQTIATKLLAFKRSHKEGTALTQAYKEIIPHAVYDI